MSRALFVAILVAASAASAGPPVRARSVSVGVGGEGLDAPIVDVTAAPRPFANGLQPFVSASAGLRGPRLTVSGGLQLRHDVCPGFFVSGDVSGGGFVVGVDAGVVAAADVVAGFVVGPLVVVVGPAVSAAAAVDNGRVSPGVVVGAVGSVVDSVDVFAVVNGGYDVGGVYGHAGDGAVSGEFVVGVRVGL